MLPPRTMQAVGVLVLAASILGYLSGLDEAALMVGVPLAAGILGGSVVGGGPEPSAPGGEDWEEAMATLSRVTKATTVVAGGFAASVAILWEAGPATAPGVGAFEVLVVFAVALLLVYAAIVAAAAILLVSHVTGRGEA